MIKKSITALALLALFGLLPAAAQEPQKEAAAKAEKMAQEPEGMAEKAEKMAEEAEGMAAKAEKVAEEAEGMAKKAETMAEEAGLSLEEVLKSHYEALGGTEAWKSVQSVRFEGNMSMGPGMDAPFVMTMKRPDKIRLEFTFQGMTGTQASDGETAWMVMPFMGKKDPEVMPADMAEQFEEQADIEGPLFDWQDKGNTVELLGVEEMEGTGVYKIKLTRANGDVRYHYLDKEFFVTVKQEGKTKLQGQEMEIETAIGDYKEHCVDPSGMAEEGAACAGQKLVMPHSIESKPKGVPTGQTITITSVAINPGDIEDDYFAMPAKPAAEAVEAQPGD